jgi:transposase
VYRSRPSLAVEDATTAADFETYVERVLAPTLRKGQVVVMDNLSAHKGERVREIIEKRIRTGLRARACNPPASHAIRAGAEKAISANFGGA